MMNRVINTEKKPIKLWLDDIEDGALEQAKNVANLPFIFKHVAVLPDSHLGYSVPIGTVVATNKEILISAVGKDISCGCSFILTSIHKDELSIDLKKKWMSKVRELVPVGMKWHKTKQENKFFDDLKIDETMPVVNSQKDKIPMYIGTMGGNNHFQELQVVTNGPYKDMVGIMIHSGSRNLGARVADHYEDIAVKLNKKYHSSVPEKHKLAFLSIDSEQGKSYLKEMNYCTAFAKANRELMMGKCLSSLKELVDVKKIFYEIDIHHNFVAMENHFGKNVLVHRKGATRAREEELGIIPGDQGSKSYVVRGKGNKNSFKSCSHGAGRVLGRKAAINKLNLSEEIEKLESQGILHTIRNKDDLQESSGAYKNITTVMENQNDLVSIMLELKTLACIKAPLKSYKKKE